ncbi:MAG: hypothetical protein FWE90_12555 [Defluviitaleaceae bacterium]|nr:hypothetical protein [Defluviitaleaceae bacterium]
MECKFENIEQFISLLKQNNEVVGILEYGGRSYKDMSRGGDYDLTIITRTCIAESIGGFHFHIASIPIDCMIKSINDFMLEEPSSEFELVHLNCKVLFERDSIAGNLLERIKHSWKQKTELTERDIYWFRFTYRHITDKLEHRLHDDVLYSNHFMSASLDWFLECYAKIKELELGKTKTHLKYIKDNEFQLYTYFIDFYNTVDIDERFKLLKLCAEYMARDIGGLWKDGEILFHLNTKYASEYEKDAVLDCIFRTK